ncbi:excalibur calcium-binding domain-containing protein [Luteococcus sp. OSA5]|uniref:excalibur calcium-binding domain-containing protein n=1 Tax=Luteococcus sp. OSA5 TaxID=3401630 RepID=UPI003B42F94B
MVQPSQARSLPSVSFRSCAQAKAAGYSNMRAGEPGYSKNLDRDGDGVACEDASGDPAPAPAPKPKPTTTAQPKPIVENPVSAGRIYSVATNGTLQLATGTLGSGMKPQGQKGTGWGGMSYLAQINSLVGDGNRDLLARRAYDNSLWLYATTTSGGAQTYGKVGQNWGGMDQIVPTFNLGGGSTQYVVARRKSDGALFRYGLTPKGLTSAVQIGRNWNGMRQIVGVGDFNRDGRADVLGLRQDGQLWFYQGTTKATLGAGKKVGQGWNNFDLAFCPGDLSSDQRYDLVGRRNDGLLFGYENRNGSWGVAKQIMSGTNTYKLMA